MKSRQKPTKIFLFVSSIFLMFTLACLTISLPFAYHAKKLVALENIIDADHTLVEEDETDNPFANSTEEKTTNNLSSITEEYLHDTHTAEEYLAALAKEYKIEHFATYIAFYGDLISPPPDAA